MGLSDAYGLLEGMPIVNGFQWRDIWGPSEWFSYVVFPQNGEDVSRGWGIFGPHPPLDPIPVPMSVLPQ